MQILLRFRAHHRPHHQHRSHTFRHEGVGPLTTRQRVTLARVRFNRVNMKGLTRHRMFQIITARRNIRIFRLHINRIRNFIRHRTPTLRTNFDRIASGLTQLYRNFQPTSAVNNNITRRHTITTERQMSVNFNR